MRCLTLGVVAAAQGKTPLFEIQNITRGLAEEEGKPHNTTQGIQRVSPGRAGAPSDPS